MNSFRKSYDTWSDAEKMGGDEHQSCTSDFSLFLGVPIQEANHYKVYGIANMPAPTNKESI